MCHDDNYRTDTLPWRDLASETFYKINVDHADAESGLAQIVKPGQTQA